MNTAKIAADNKPAGNRTARLDRRADFIFNFALI